MSDSIEKWKHERGRLSAPPQSRVRQTNLEKSQCEVQNETRSFFSDDNEKLLQSKTVPMSQTLDALYKKIQENKVVLQRKKDEKDELTKLCGRQAENIHLCSQAISLSSNKLSNDVNLREAWKTKYEKAFGLFHKLYFNTKCVTDSLHKVEAVRERVEPYTKDMKTKSEEMANFVKETISVTLPRYKHNATVVLKEEQKKLADEIATGQKALNSLQQHHESEKMLIIDQISKEEVYSNELRLKVQEEKQLSEDLANHLNKTCHERNEQKKFLEEKVEAVMKDYRHVEKELVCVSKDCDEYDLKVESLKIKLLDSETRENQLQNVIEQLHQKANDTALLISHEKTDLILTESKLNCGKDASTSLNSEINDIRQQLSEEKANGDKEFELLEDERLKAKTTFSERRQSLLEDLKAARLKDTELLNEEGKLQSNLFELKNDIESLITNNSTGEQFNSALANNLTTIDCEIQELAKDIEEKHKSLSTGKITAQELENTLSASKQNLEEFLSEVNENLTQLAQEEICVVQELETLEREEQQLNHKLQMLRTDMEESHLLSTEQHNQKLKEAEEKIFKLEGDLAKESKRKEELIISLQEHLELLNGNLAREDQLIVDLDSSIILQEETLKSIEIRIKERMEAKVEKEGIVENYKQDILKYSENDKEINIEGKEISSNLQVLDLNLKNINQNIDKLLLVQKDKETSISSTAEDHKKKKQILLQNYLHYQSTSEYCADEIKSLEKQSISWNDKIGTAQEESKKLMEGIESCLPEIKKSKIHFDELDRELQELVERESALIKEITLTEEETIQVKKKHDRLQARVHAAMSAQKRKKQANFIDSSEGTSQAATFQGTVTPQFSSIGGGPGEPKKEVTPKSILKTPSKCPTPQSAKRVKFADVENDVPSSGSTIVVDSVLIGELEANPGDRSNILKRFADQRRAEKRAESVETEVSQRADKRKFEDGPITFKVPEKTASQHPILHQRIENSRSVDADDDGNSSTSTINLDDYADELAENPLAIRAITARRAEQRLAKKMRLSNSQAQSLPPVIPQGGVNEISSSTPEPDPDWMK